MSFLDFLANNGQVKSAMPKPLVGQQPTDTTTTTAPMIAPKSLQLSQLINQDTPYTANDNLVPNFNAQEAAATRMANIPTGLTHPIKLLTHQTPTGQVVPNNRLNPLHPNFWKEVGRIGEGVGNVLGDVFAPSTMELIPGTQLNREFQAASGRQQLSNLQKELDAARKSQSQSALEGSQAKEAEANAAKARATTAAGGTWTPTDYTTTIGGKTIPLERNEYGIYRPIGSGMQAQSTGTAENPVFGGTSGMGPITKAAPVTEATQPLGDTLQKTLQNNLNGLVSQYGLDPKSYQLPNNATQEDFTRLQTQAEDEGRAKTYTAQQRFNQQYRNQQQQENQITRTNTELDRVENQFVRPMQTTINNASAQLDKIQEAQSLLSANTAESTALAIPKVLTALVSGQGSGVRITLPELNMIGHARGISGDVQGAIQKMMGKSSLTPEQTTQLLGILQAATDRVNAKLDLANNAVNALYGAQSRDEAHKINQEYNNKLNDLIKFGYYVGEATPDGKIITKIYPNGRYDAQ